MRPETAPNGHSDLQFALHGPVCALIARKYLSKDAMSEAWDRIAKGPKAEFDPLVLTHGAGAALARMRRAQG
jgi:hypothetical protein